MADQQQQPDHVEDENVEVHVSDDAIDIIVHIAQPPDEQIETENQIEEEAVAEEPEVSVPDNEPEVDIPENEPEVGIPENEPEVGIPENEPEVGIPENEPEVGVIEHEPEVVQIEQDLGPAENAGDALDNLDIDRRRIIRSRNQRHHNWLAQYARHINRYSTPDEARDALMDVQFLRLPVERRERVLREYHGVITRYLANRFQIPTREMAAEGEDDDDNEEDEEDEEDEHEDEEPEEQEELVEIDEEMDVDYVPEDEDETTEEEMSQDDDDNTDEEADANN